MGIESVKRSYILTKLLKTAVKNSDQRILIGCVSDSDLPESYKTILTAAEFTTHHERKLNLKDTILSSVAQIEKQVMKVTILFIKIFTYKNLTQD